MWIGAPGPMHSRMMSTARWRRADRGVGPASNDDVESVAPPSPSRVPDEAAPALDAVARLSTPSPDRIESHVEISIDAWRTLDALVVVLASIASRVGVDEELGWRVAALQRAVATRDPSPLPLALGDTGREPPPAVVAWAEERATAEELAEVAVWFLADGACAIAEGADLDVLRGAWALLESWSAAR